MHRTHPQGWLRPLTTVTTPSRRLVCFPHSGGSASSYAPWVPFVLPDTELIAVQYPGRGDRFADDLVDDVKLMARHAVAELIRLPACEVVLFGHSLGAVVAYEAARRMRELGVPPAELCLSACSPPDLESTLDADDPDLHLLPNDELWKRLCALGGIESDMATNAELRELLMPSMRSDLRAHAVYRPGPPGPVLECPVTCYHGEGDPLVDPALLDGWAAITSGPFALKVRPGGHFHVSTDVAELVGDIGTRVPSRG
ncbi:MAG: thioesterase [Micrococcales bacterium]|nr:MAG: thioesterase [Micrococcales bacterium]